MTTTNYQDRGLDYHDLNAMLNLFDENGKLQLDADKEATRQYFLQHVNQNTVFFHSLDEKLEYLVENNYYDKSVLDKYSKQFLHKLWDFAYSNKFRFASFLGAYKYYTSYTLKTSDNKKYLERYEDRVCMTALYLANGDQSLAMDLVEEIIENIYQPATPTFLNAGKAQRGEMVSCFLLRIEDNMESIGRSINSALQLSKRGGGVSFLMTNLRPQGAPIKGVHGQASGVVPIMKIFEDSFSYANQLGVRQGAGVVYLNAHHPDIMKFLDTKRENADEKIRIKTLSLGVVIPDITFELAKNNEDMYLFSPYDVKRFYGKSMSDLSITEYYRTWVNDPRIYKTKINAREFFSTLAEIQFESGYPYVLFEDHANRHNNIHGRINMSNLCVEILQTNEESTYNQDLTYDKLGKDISCNLGSLNIAKIMLSKNFEHSIDIAIRGLTSVSLQSDISSVPSIANGNNALRAIGLGAMNLHGFLAKEGIKYGSPEALDFTNIFFYTVFFYALKSSNKLAIKTKSPFEGFENSKYADGTALEKYTTKVWEPRYAKIRKLFSGIKIPTVDDWIKLDRSIRKHGIFNAYLLAIPPTGSISYINNSTPSIHPVTSKIEIRKEGRTGRTYYPAPYLTNENMHLYEDAYEVGYEKLIDTYAEAGQHVDQGLSLTVFFKDNITTRDINKMQIYAWKKGIRTIYYVRLRQQALEGTEVAHCVSCVV
jgi:ribonucleoside-diphosphate reductase alpha chain